jgi:general secretion pathway protein K
MIRCRSRAPDGGAQSSARIREAAKKGDRPLRPLQTGFGVCGCICWGQSGLSPFFATSRIRRPSQRGSALLTVLWLAAALAAIGFAVATSVRSEIDRVGSDSEGLRAWYLATGSVERAIQWMLWGPGVTNPDGSPRWRPNLPRMTMSYPSGDAIVELIPESAKLNINTASQNDLTRVVTVVTGDSERAAQIVAGIVDWRAGSAGSMFDQYYATLGPSFRARHASFQEIEELLAVQGMTPELFYGNYLPDSAGRLYASGGLRDCLSVWGSLGPFDINTASPALMEAMGMTPDAAAAVVKYRATQPFKSMSDVAALGVSAPRMTTGGNFIWTLRATARLRGAGGQPSEFVRTAAATVKLLDPRAYPTMPAHVLRWYDDAWSQSAVVPGAPPQ